MPQLDSQFYISQIFWLLVCVFSLLFFIKNFFYPKIKEGINERDILFENYEKDINEIKSKILLEKNRHEACLKDHQKKTKNRIQKKISELHDRKIFHLHTLEKDMQEETVMEKVNLKPLEIDDLFIHSSLLTILKKIKL
jgi:F0F1-type ATP synthase membrane subunit b/b'